MTGFSTYTYEGEDWYQDGRYRLDVSVLDIGPGYVMLSMIDRDGDHSVINFPSGVARDIAQSITEAAECIDNPRLPEIGETVTSAAVLDRLPEESILRNVDTQAPYWRDPTGWRNPYAECGLTADGALGIAVNGLVLLHVGGNA